jgi:hypothetical protein
LVTVTTVPAVIVRVDGRKAKFRIASEATAGAVVVAVATATVVVDEITGEGFTAVEVGTVTGAVGWIPAELGADFGAPVTPGDVEGEL